MPLHNKKVVFEVDLIDKSKSDRERVEFTFTQNKDGNINVSVNVSPSDDILLYDQESCF